MSTYLLGMPHHLDDDAMDIAPNADPSRDVTQRSIVGEH
jgi:hypothetical protein